MNANTLTKSWPARRTLFYAVTCGAVSLGGARLLSADFNVSNSGFSAYVINADNNPTLMLQRGKTYIFAISASGHPFWIKSVRSTGTGSAFTDGMTGNGIATGTLTFAVPTNAPGTLFYNCQFHISMTGDINIVDAPPPPTINILSLVVSNSLFLKSTGASNYSVLPEFTTNVTSTNWFALTVQTNRFLNGTNETLCGKPPGDPVFIRIKSNPK